jgi:hypothetical protein
MCGGFGYRARPRFATAHGSAPTPESPRHRAALTFIFVTVMVDMLAFGIIIPVLPHLIVQLIGGSIARRQYGPACSARCSC